MLLNGQDVPEHVKLRAHADLQSHDIKLVFDVEATDPSVAACWHVEAGELLDQRGLPCAIRSKKSKELAAAHGECDVLVSDNWLHDARIHFPNILNN